MNKLYMSKESDVMWELVKIEGKKIYVQNHEVEGKFTVRPECDPLEVFNNDYEYIGEIE